MIYDLILSRLDHPKTYKVTHKGIISAARASCPCCGGESRSKFNISLTSSGSILLYCHGGCDVNSILNSIDLNATDLFPINANKLSINQSQASSTIKGWDWWSLSSALENLAEELTKVAVGITLKASQDDEYRALMFDVTSKIKTLSLRYSYGRRAK